MNNQEKKELLQDFIDKLWNREIYLIGVEQPDYGDGETNYHYQQDDEIINWYLKNS